MMNLKKLDLGFNKFMRIENCFECLKDLRELNLSFNKIESIENLNKLPNLRVLILDFNKIKKIENIKTLRKLEILSLTGNLLEDINIGGSLTEPMLELKELNVSKNKIKYLKNV